MSGFQLVNGGLYAGKVRIDEKGIPERSCSRAKLLLLQKDESKTGQCAKMARLALKGFSDVVDRFPISPHQKENGRAGIPAFGEGRRLLDNLAEVPVSASVPPCPDRLTAVGKRLGHHGVVRFPPQGPDFRRDVVG